MKTRILFLCTGNSCRSQMAEGWAKHLKANAIEPHSAGVEPHGMNARAVAVMREAGVDISSHRSKHVDELRDVPFDYVVTVCGHANETCPVFPGRTKVAHVAFDDPPQLAKGAATEEDALKHYRRVRDEIRAFVETLPASLEERRGASRAMNKYAAEFFGTFAMVFAGTGAIVINRVSDGAITHAGVAITWGLIVMAMIYALGDVSGARFNPAVTCGFWLSGRFPARCVGPYVAAQVAGAFLASAALRLMFGNVASLGASLPAGSDWQSFALELVLTAILMFVILNVSTGPQEVGVMAGIAVGGVIGLEAMFAGPICGASMNPARSLAPAIVSGNLRALWVYLVAPVIGAAIAVPCWRLTRPPVRESIVRADVEKLPLEA